MSAGAAPQPLIAFLRTLRSVRHFRPEAVPQAAIDDMLQVARWSNSARNRQPWAFIVVRDPATLQALAALEGSAKHLAGAPLGVVLIMDGEPEFVVQDTFDEGRLTERIQLAAAAHGLGSCVGWLKGSGAAAATAMLGIPAGRLVRSIVSIGYPDEAAHQARPRPVLGRKQLAELVHDERYQAKE